MTKTLPKEAPGPTWKLQKAKVLTFRQHLADLTINKGEKNERVWAITSEIAGRALYLETDLPHPDDADWPATYELLAMKSAKDLADELLKLEIEPRKKDK